MKLDRSKKYKFCGHVYQCDDSYGWDGQRYWTATEFQHFADGGLVEEASEPVEIEFTVKDGGQWMVDGFGMMFNTFSPDMWGKTFRCVEVLK